MKWIFWISAGFVAYTLVGYPFLVALISLFRKREQRREPILPSVSFIITVRDEADNIGRKLRNSMALTYPREKLEIVVVSDASDDGTDDIVRNFAAQGVRLISLPERKGKHYGQMIGRDCTKGEILVFSDAAISLDPNAVQAIVSNFADPSVGAVSSEDTVTSHHRGRWGEGVYIQLEMLLRRAESRLNSLVGVSGSFFAARRDVCSEWHSNQSTDFFVALHAVQQGLRAVVDPKSRGYYDVVPDNRTELQRKVRTIVHGLEVFFAHRELLNPFKYGMFAWQFASHKLFRWMMPFAMALLFISNLPLSRVGALYRWALVLQVMIYALGSVTLFSRRLAGYKPLKLASFFVLGNMATILAWAHYCMGEKFVTWEPTRRG